MLIEKARPEDVRPIFELIDQFRFRAGNTGYLLPTDKPRISGLIRQGNFLVARPNSGEGPLAGCTSLVEYEGIVELRSLAVLEKYQHKGIGEMLINLSKQEARKKGYNQIYALANHNAESLFRKAGFYEAKVPEQKLEKDCKYCLKYNKSCNERTLVALL